MAILSIELYELLKQGGIDETIARKVAAIVLTEEDKGQLVTKADLIEAKADLIKWNLGVLVAMTALFGGIVSLLKLF